MKIENIDFNRDYYNDLQVNENTENITILRHYYNVVDEINADETITDRQKRLEKEYYREAVEVLTDKHLRYAYDHNITVDPEAKKDEKKSETKATKNEEKKTETKTTKKEETKKEEPKHVEETKENEESLDAADKGREFINSKTLTWVVCAAILGVSAIVASKNVSDAIKENKTVVESNDDVEQEEVIEETPVVVQEQNVEAEQITEAAVEETPVVEEEVSYDVNSYTNIDDETNRVFAELATLDGSGRGLSVDLDKNTVEALVKYVRHSYPNYTLGNDISNEYAYEILFALAKDGVDISMFYNNLDTYENIKQLYDACASIRQESNSYEDEVNAYSAMNKAVSTMHYEENGQRTDCPEIIAIRALVDAYIDIPSMQLARGGAIENSLEGEAYNIEKQYAAKNSADCKEIFNKVSIENPNALLTRATYKAIDEDEALGLTR